MNDYTVLVAKQPLVVKDEQLQDVAALWVQALSPENAVWQATDGSQAVLAVLEGYVNLINLGTRAEVE